LGSGPATKGQLLGLDFANCEDAIVNFGVRMLLAKAKFHSQGIGCRYEGQPELELSLVSSRFRPSFHAETFHPRPSALNPDLGHNHAP
jgi:hypothetical protein